MVPSSVTHGLAGCRISSADIKDKSPLIEARKSIENEMERFKVCEKEAKTKAFSKAALGAAVKADPKEAQREAARDWLSSTVDNVNQKVGPAAVGPPQVQLEAGTHARLAD
jgi:CCR4-NOT transcriptional regulation complex NOT5 subunit